MATARTLLETSDMWFAALTCRREDEEWGEHNVTTHPIVAFPSIPVWQAHDGARRTLMTPNHAVFHHDGGGYRRERFDERGYRCLFFFPSEALVREMAAEVDPAMLDAAAFRFPDTVAPLPARALARARRLATSLAAAGLDSGRAREDLYAVLRDAVHAAFRRRNARAVVRPRTEAAHEDVVEEAKELIARRLSDHLLLDDVAARVHVSPYHLSRIFRARTGYSIHGYTMHLRLREGLDRLELDRRRDLARVGGDLGFSSHSHFTASFRRVFGMPPSQIETGRFLTA